VEGHAQEVRQVYAHRLDGGGSYWIIDIDIEYSLFVYFF
jgi:hypothetical protein